jgi:hypothetical protein
MPNPQQIPTYPPPNAPTGPIDTSARVNIAEVLGPPKTIALSGKSFQARRLTMDDLAEFESHLRGLNAANFLDVATSRQLGADIISSTLDKLYNAPWEPETKLAHAQSISGIRFFLWRTLSAYNNITLEETGQLISSENLEEALSALDTLRDMPPEGTENPPEPQAVETQ